MLAGSRAPTPLIANGPLAPIDFNATIVAFARSREIAWFAALYVGGVANVPAPAPAEVDGAGPVEGRGAEDDDR